MAELAPHITPDQFEMASLPEVVTALMHFYDMQDEENSDHDNNTTPDAEQPTDDDILVSYGFDPEDERSQMIANAVYELSGPESGSKAMARSVFNDIVLYRATGLYDDERLAMIAAKKANLPIFNAIKRPDNYTRYEKAEMRDDAMEFGRSMVALADFLHQYAELEHGPTDPLPPEQADEPAPQQESLWKYLGKSIAKMIGTTGKLIGGSQPNADQSDAYWVDREVSKFAAVLDEDNLIDNMLMAPRSPIQEP